MAAYAVTVTFDQPMTERWGRTLAAITGVVDITNYNSTLAEITEITNRFKILRIVIPDGKSDAGYAFDWVPASKAFKVWQCDLSASVDGPEVECGDDVDVGEVQFLAIGIAQ